MYKSKAVKAHIEKVAEELVAKFVASGTIYTCRASVENVITNEALSIACGMQQVNPAVDVLWYSRQFVKRAHEMVHAQWEATWEGLSK